MRVMVDRPDPTTASQEPAPQEDARAERGLLSRGLEAAEATDLFGRLAEMVDDLVFVTEPGGRILWTNQKFTEHTGFTVSDFQFDNPDNPFLHPDDVARVGKFYVDFFASPAPVSSPIENRFYDRWGGCQHYRSVLAKVTWQGSPACMLVTTPITAVLPQAFEASEARYRRLVETARDSILTIGPDGGFRFANAHFLQLTGMSHVELARHKVWDLVHPDDQPQVREKVSAAASSGAPLRFECRLLTAAGEEHIIDVNASPIAEATDDSAFQAIVRDVTEARRLSDRVRQAQKLEELGVLAGGIAHDFNNLVAAILGNASLAQKRLARGESIDALLDDVQMAGQRAASLAGALLQYVGRAPRRREPVDLVVLVTELHHLARALVPKSVNLRLVTTDSRVLVFGDANQLQQVVLNLIVNGAEAIQGSGTVKIEVGIGPVGNFGGFWAPGAPGSGPYAHLRVSDTGSGMDAETRRRMFDPFFTTKPRGRGLGLSAVLGIITSHEGAIRIESSPGHGTVVDVVLRPAEPAALSTPGAQAVPTPPSPQAATGHVLFVDDEDLLRRLGKEILEQSGYQVTVAPDAETAIDLVRVAPRAFSAVVLDQNMPGMGGQAGTECLRSMCPDLPILMMSGYGDDARLEGIPFLAKPYSADELLAAIGQLVSPNPCG